MKLISTIIRKKLFVVALVLQLISFQSFAQICANSANVIWGLSNAGDIYPITIATGVVGPRLNAPFPGNAPSSPNGVGYNNINSRFYFFKRAPNSGSQEFVSYDASLNLTTILRNCPTTYIVYVGCVTPDGLSYYCWDSRGTLFYYNIPANTWTQITSSFVDNLGNDVDAVIRTHGSGDVTIDGYGNMLMVPSSASKYALYEMAAPLPKTPVASVVVRELVPLTNPPGKFVGITLTSTGQILMATANPQNRLYRLENNLSLTFVSTLSLDMADLTSCNFPTSILPITFKGFTASLKNNKVSLDWQISKDEPVLGYTIERSNNSTTWEKIGEVNAVAGNLTTSFSFMDNVPASGKNFYRIVINKQDGQKNYSAIKRIDILEKVPFAIGPNPVQNVLQIQNNGQTNRISSVEIFDQAGRKVRQSMLSIGLNTINMADLGKGVYNVNVSQADGSRTMYKILKL